MAAQWEGVLITTVLAIVGREKRKVWTPQSPPNTRLCLLTLWFNYCLKRTELAVNWFDYPICLFQAWFQRNCSSSGKKWQVPTLRRRPRAAITAAWTWPARVSRPQHLPRPPSSWTRTPLPMDNSRSTLPRGKGRSMPTPVCGQYCLPPGRKGAGGLAQFFVSGKLNCIHRGLDAHMITSECVRYGLGVKHLIIFTFSPWS